VQSIRSEIIRADDEVEYINGEIKHKVDIFKSNKQRGEAKGAYVIIKINNQEITKVMNHEDILKFKSFSKSAGSGFSPWNEAKDPELWMWRKTVLKQASKLLPKNDAFARAIEEDNKDSTISDEKINEMQPDEVINEKLAGFEEAETGDKKDIS
jgi:recombinational DNA repair protein RecT